MSWFLEEHHYRGTGIARFDDPHGEFRGPTEVFVDGTGAARIEMNVEAHSPEQPSAPNWYMFFECEETSKKGVWQPRAEPNRCTSLKIKTDGGTLSALGPQLLSNADYGRFSFAPDDGLNWLEFHPSRVEFSADEESEPHYWVMPILDFRISEARAALLRRDLDDAVKEHPIRLHPGTPVIPFEYCNAPAFIEVLPDYKERLARLDEDRFCSQVTALMVCQAGQEEEDLAQKQDLPQIRLFGMLRLVAGNDIEASGIELRGKEGQLVRRVHARMGRQPGPRHEWIIDDRNFGRFLSCVSRRLDDVDAHVTTAVRRLVASIQDVGSLDRSIGDVTAALDALCQKAGIVGKRLSDLLPEDARSAVRTILKDTASKIHRMSRQHERVGDLDGGSVLRAIADTALNADGRSGIYGMVIRELLDKHQLHDFAAIGHHFQQKYGEAWENRLSMFRAVGVHAKLLDEEMDEALLREWWTLVRHLQDIVVRVILKTIEYDGEYSPITFCQARGAETVDWVRPDTRPDSLGY